MSTDIVVFIRISKDDAFVRYSSGKTVSIQIALAETLMEGKEWEKAEKSLNVIEYILQEEKDYEATKAEAEAKAIEEENKRVVAEVPFPHNLDMIQEEKTELLGDTYMSEAEEVETVETEFEYSKTDYVLKYTQGARALIEQNNLTHLELEQVFANKKRVAKNDLQLYLSSKAK